MFAGRRAPVDGEDVQLRAEHLGGDVRIRRDAGEVAPARDRLRRTPGSRRHTASSAAGTAPGGATRPPPDPSLTAFSRNRFSRVSAAAVSLSTMMLRKLISPAPDDWAAATVDLWLPEATAMSISSISNVTLFDGIQSPKSARHLAVTFGSVSEQLLYRTTIGTSAQASASANALIRRRFAAGSAVASGTEPGASAWP